MGREFPSMSPAHSSISMWILNYICCTNHQQSTHLTQNFSQEQSDLFKEHINVLPKSAHGNSERMYRGISLAMQMKPNCHFDTATNGETQKIITNEHTPEREREKNGWRGKEFESEKMKKIQSVNF